MEITIKINGRAVSVDVSYEVYEYLCESDHKAQYSLDCNDGIENDALHRIPSPEEILMQKQSLEQLYEALNASNKTTGQIRLT